jgi:hypothetical protein
MSATMTCIIPYRIMPDARSVGIKSTSTLAKE